MTRVRRGYIARKRPRKIRLFASSFRGAHSRLTQTATQQKIRALVSSHRVDEGKSEIFVVLIIGDNGKNFYPNANRLSISKRCISRSMMHCCYKSRYWDWTCIYEIQGEIQCIKE
ncbi:50S ribosomal protein L20 [Nymphaea thermarum]|nr:50S ribosomal protein L20 [Nymphaea thermarum]